MTTYPAQQAQQGSQQQQGMQQDPAGAASSAAAAAAAAKEQPPQRQGPAFTAMGAAGVMVESRALHGCPGSMPNLLINRPDLTCCLLPSARSYLGVLLEFTHEQRGVRTRTLKGVHACPCRVSAGAGSVAPGASRASAMLPGPAVQPHQKAQRRSGKPAACSSSTELASSA